MFEHDLPSDWRRHETREVVTAIETYTRAVANMARANMAAAAHGTSSDWKRAHEAEEAATTAQRAVIIALRAADAD